MPKESKNNEQILNWIETKNKYIESLNKTKEKSEDDFEKNINAIAAGALLISFTFHQFIVPIKEANYLFLLFISWFAFGFVMLFNLYSNYYSITKINQINEQIESLDDNKQIDDTLIIETSKKTSNFNILKIIILCIGFTTLFSYAIINILNNHKSKIMDNSSDKTNKNSDYKKSPIKTRIPPVLPKELKKKEENKKTESSLDKKEKKTNN